MALVQRTNFAADRPQYHGTLGALCAQAMENPESRGSLSRGRVVNQVEQVVAGVVCHGLVYMLSADPVAAGEKTQLFYFLHRRQQVAFHLVA